jgi:hypothetical protein
LGSYNQLKEQQNIYNKFISDLTNMVDLSLWEQAPAIDLAHLLIKKQSEEN